MVEYKRRGSRSNFLKKSNPRNGLRPSNVSRKKPFRKKIFSKNVKIVIGAIAIVALFLIIFLVILIAQSFSSSIDVGTSTTGFDIQQSSIKYSGGQVTLDVKRTAGSDITGLRFILEDSGGRTWSYDVDTSINVGATKSFTIPVGNNLENVAKISVESITSTTTSSSGYCGDLICNNGETAGTCSVDCFLASCGDGVCSSGETSSSCSSDCTSSGGTSSGSTNVVASFEVETFPGIPFSVNFNATDSTSTEGSIVNYSWDFEDGSQAEGVFVNHNFTDVGSYFVTLTIEDASGNTDSTGLDVEVLTPSVVITSPTNGSSFDSSGSVNNITLDFTTTNWDVGGIGEDHVNFLFNGDSTPYEFYNGNDDVINYDGAQASDVLRIDSNTMLFLNLAEGNYDVKLFLVDGNDLGLEFDESNYTVEFSILPCGNSLIDSGEQCDDGNILDGDGCSSICTIESGFSCNGEPSVCNPIGSNLSFGLVGYYTLDNNDISDQSGNGNDGVAVGGLDCTDVPGIFDNGCRFSQGSGEYIDVSLVDDDTNPMNGTITAWASPYGNASNSGYVVFGSGPNVNRYYLQWSTDQEFSVFRGNPSTSINLVQDPGFNQWHNLALVWSFNGSDQIMEGYFDGSLVSSSVYNGSDVGAPSFKIGSRGTSDREFNGIIDEVRFYDRPLNSSEIMDIYNSFTCGNLIVDSGEQCDDGNTFNYDGCSSSCQNEVNLLAYYNFDNNDATDSSGNGNDGVNNGASFFDGIFSKSASFDGLNGQISLADNSIFDFERTDDFSFSAWFNTSDGQSTFQSILSKQQNSAPFRGYALQVENVDSTTYGLRLIITSDNSPTDQISVRTINNFTYGNWHQIVGTYDGSSTANGAKIYLDGVEETTFTINDNLVSTIQNNVTFAISGREAQSALFNGTLDEVKVFDNALTSNEVSELYNNDILIQLGPPTIDRPSLLERFFLELKKSFKRVFLLD